jgi:hypothetical protein
MRTRPGAAVFALGVAVGLLAPSTGPAQESRDVIGLQGRLTDDTGQPLRGPVDLHLTLFDAASDGVLQYAEEHLGVELAPGGVYSLLVGTGKNAIGSLGAAFDSPSLWAQVVVDGEVLAPRTKLSSAAYAFSADRVGRGDFALRPAVTGAANRLAGELRVDGRIRTGTPTQATDPDDAVATKGYVDALGSGASSKATVDGELESYTVLHAMRNSVSCPAGYTLKSFDDLKGQNGWLYTNVIETGLFFGGLNSIGYGHERIYVQIHDSEGIKFMCWRTYRTRGRPHAHVMYTQAASCPAGYVDIPSSNLMGNNGWTYSMTTDAGLYIGYVNSWSFESQPYENAYHARQWTSHVTRVCYRIMGIEEDPSTAGGVFPVVIGIAPGHSCPSGFTFEPTSNLSNTNDSWSYMVLNDNTTAMGGLHNWWFGGENYANTQWHTTHLINYCWKFLPRGEVRPRFTVKVPKTGGCDTGEMTLPKSQIQGWNTWSYYMQTGDALYAGGLYSWWVNDYNDGFVQHGFVEQADRICLGIDND